MGFDFSTVVAPFRMQPGLRRLADGAAQLTPLALGDTALREKLAVLSSYPHQAFVASREFDPGPALDALVAHAVAEHPQALLRPGARSARAAALGWSVENDSVIGTGPEEIGACLRALAPPWRLPGLLSLAFAEDFAVIDGATGRIPWLAVCLPSNWAPEEKVGRLFAEVHAPVADNAMLIAAADALARLVTEEARWERFVWTLTDSARLHRHPAHSGPNFADAPRDPAALAAVSFLRTEHQTFIPVPAHRQAIFTIHVDVLPLGQATADPMHAARLHAALASMSAAVLAYRGLTAVREPLLEWLAARVARST
jgi:hypothetical protein